MRALYPNTRPSREGGFAQILVLGVLMIMIYTISTINGQWHAKNAQHAQRSMLRKNMELIQRNLQWSFDCRRTQEDANNQINCGLWAAGSYPTGTPSGCVGGGCNLKLFGYGGQYANGITEYDGSNHFPPQTFFQLQARCPYLGEKDKTGAAMTAKSILLEMRLMDQTNPTSVVSRWSGLQGWGRDGWFNVFQSTLPQDNPFQRTPQCLIP